MAMLEIDCSDRRHSMTMRGGVPATSSPGVIDMQN